jgi:hypothetical protein
VLLSELNTCQILGAYRNEIIQISAAQGTWNLSEDIRLAQELLVLKAYQYV